MFNSKTEAIDKLSEAIASGNINDSIWDSAKAKAAKIVTEETERKQAAKEKRRLMDIEYSRPPIKFHKLFNLKDAGPVYMDELLEYCKTYNLAELKSYLADFLAGRWNADDFKNGSVYQAYSFLLSQVQAREKKA